MNRRLTYLLVLLPAAGAVLLTLRADLSRWQLQQGVRLYRHGDLNGAIDAWSSIYLARSDRAKALFSRGAARYRLGSYSAAAADFTAAAASETPQLQKSLYNLGTALLAAEQASVQADRARREQQLTRAVRELQRAAELDSADAAARHNLDIARARLSLHTKDKSEASPLAPPGREAISAGQKKIEQSAAKPEHGGAATELDSASGQRRKTAAMTPEEALRMLNDARGREALRSAAAAGTRREKPSAPEKDW